MSCDEAQEIEAENGHIYMTGFAAVQPSIATIIETNANKEYDIICSGSTSCYLSADSTIIRNANNLYCGGHQSCYETSLITNINNVYGYGYQALRGTTIEYIDGSVYCGARLACYQSTIENIGNDVYAGSDCALHQSIVKNVGK